MKKRSLLGLMALSPLTGLVGCGGSDGNNANIRLVNMAPGYSDLDLYYQDSNSNLTQWISNVGVGTASNYTGVSSGTDTLVFTNSGSTSSLLSQSRSLSSGDDYSIIAYTTAGVLKGTSIAETVSTPSSNQARVAVLNAAVDAGAVDVYLTTASDSALDTATPTFPSLTASGAISGYNLLTVGSTTTYRLWVTAAGDKTDVRLKIDGVIINSQQVVSLVLTSASSGMLVDAIQLVQGGAATPLINQQARVRVISAVNAGSVDLTLGSTALAAADIPPNIPLDYTLVNVGTLAVTCTIDSVVQSFANVTLTAGSDVTLLVWGDSAATAQLTVITDDNRAPISTSGIKVRLLNGMNGVSTPLSLKINGGLVASGVSEGAASTYTSMTADASYATVQVSTTGYPSLVSWTVASGNAPTAATHVYTMYMFGTTAVPNPQWVRDR